MCRYWSSPVRVLKGLTSNNGKNKIYFIFSTHKSHFGFIVQGGFFYFNKKERYYAKNSTCKRKASGRFFRFNIPKPRQYESKQKKPKADR